MMAEGETIDIRDLPDYLRDKPLSEMPEKNAPATLEQMERSHALRVLESVGGNKVRAAELLGVSRTKLYRILGESDSEVSPATSPTDWRTGSE